MAQSPTAPSRLPGRSVPPLHRVDGDVGRPGDAPCDLVVADLLATLVVGVDGVRHEGHLEALCDAGHAGASGQSRQNPTLAAGSGSTRTPTQTRRAPAAQRTAARTGIVTRSPAARVTAPLGDDRTGFALAVSSAHRYAPPSPTSCIAMENATRIVVPRTVVVGACSIETSVNPLARPLAPRSSSVRCAHAVCRRTTDPMIRESAAIHATRRRLAVRLASPAGDVANPSLSCSDAHAGCVRPVGRTATGAPPRRRGGDTRAAT